MGRDGAWWKTARPSRGPQCSGRRGKFCTDMLGVEAPLKKVSTGLGDRLTKAEGGPEVWQAEGGNIGEGLATLGTWGREAC